MFKKLTKPICLTLIILSYLFACPLSYAPTQEKPLAIEFYDIFEGTPWQRKRAIAGFNKWPRVFGHTQQEIYDIMYKETEGRFHASAYNARSHARGIMQVRVIAFEDIAPPRGKSFFYYKSVSSNARIKFLDKKMAYDPYWNIFAGCAYFARCKQMARRTGPQTAGGFTFSVERMQKIYYNAGIGTWRRTIKGVLDYSL